MSIDVKSQRLATWVKWGIGLVGVAIVGPVAFAALKSLMAIGAAIAVAGVISIGITQVAPALSFIISNWIMKLTKWEAAHNPIETLQSQYLERAQQLQATAEHISDFDTNVRTFGSKLKTLKEQFPNDAVEFDQQMVQLQALLFQQRDLLANAWSKLHEFQGEIMKASAKWDLAMSAQAAFKSAGKADENAMQMIKRETALDSVELELNRAFAELTTSINQEIPGRRSSRQETIAQARAISRVQGVQP